MTPFDKLQKQLETKIQKSYEEGVTLGDAEKLAGEFLYAMMAVSTELKAADLDSKMRKSGVKAVRAAIYLKFALADAKKPSDVMLSAMVDTDTVVQTEQDSYDKAEVDRDALERSYNIFKEAHVYFRGVAKGKFE